MVGHGGFGTTLGALLAGVPQVVVPLFADQPHNAAAGSPTSAPASPPTRRTPRACAPPSSGCSRSPPSGSPRAAIALEAQGLPPIDDAPAAVEALVAAAREERAA